MEADEDSEAVGDWSILWLRSSVLLVKLWQSNATSSLSLGVMRSSRLSDNVEHLLGWPYDMLSLVISQSLLIYASPSAQEVMIKQSGYEAHFSLAI